MHFFLGMERALNPIIKEFVTPKAFMPLLHPWAYLLTPVIIIALVTLVIIVAHQVPNWTRPLITFLDGRSA